MSKHAKKSAKKPALKRSLLSHAVAVAAVAVGGFGQQAFAVDLCTTASTTVSALSPADECLLDAAGDILTVTAAGSLGQGVDATAAPVTISNLGLIADDYTAIDFNSVGLDGSLTNEGTVEVDSGLDWAMGVYVRNNASIGGPLNNSGTSATINAVAVDAGSYAYAYGIYVDGESTSTPWTDLNPATNATHYTSDYSDIGLEATGTLINSGTVSASADVNTYSAYATGLNINGAILGDITNSGIVSAAADARYGAYAHGARMGGGWIGTGDQTGSSSTVGEANLTAYAYVGEQTYVGLGAAANLVNSGTISASANVSGVSASDASATALYVNGVVQGSLDNSGTISAEANNTNYYGAEARAVYLDGGSINTWSGSGSSSVDVTGPVTSTNSETTWASTWSDVGLDSSAALTNSGAIEAMAYSYGYSVYAQALYIGDAVLGSVSNSSTGSVVASAEADFDSNAYARAIEINGGWIGNESGSWNQSTDSSTSLELDTYASTSGSQTASAWSYIGLGAGAALTNAGTVQALADAGSDWASAAGVQIDGAVLGSVVNSGSISASAQTDNNYAFADAVALYGGDIGSESGSDVYTDYSASTNIVSPTETQSAWSTATGTNYASENSYIGLGSAAALTNSGTISAAAHAGWYYARAEGLTVDGAVLGSVANTGSIAVSAQADGYNANALGVGLWGGWIDSESQSWSWSDEGTTTVVTSVPVNSTAVTNASTTAWSTDSAWSYIGIGSGASLTNSGTIAVSADANYSSTAYAAGIEIDGAVLGTVSNSGTITVSAEAGENYSYADGVAVYGGDIGSESYNESQTWNDMWSSTVTVNATSTATVTAWATTGASMSNYASEYSYIGLGSAAALTNSGTISVSADADNYYARAEGLTVDGTVLGSIDNSGSIVASAEAYDSPNALGLAVYGDYIGNYTEQESYDYNDAGTYTTTTDTATLDVTTLGTSAGGTATTWTSASTWADTALGSAAALTNSGTISATARADQYWAYATGVELSDAVLGQVNNLGTISATAINDNYQGAGALGMQLGGGWIGSYDNSGSWSRSYDATSSSSPATLSSASTTNSASAWNYVSTEGYIGLGSAAALTNSGTISAAANVWGGSTGSSAWATALSVDGAVQGAIDNSGTISASASVDGNGSGYYASAYGLYLDGGSFSSDSEVGNWSGATTVDTSNTDLATSITTTAWAYNSASASVWASADSDVGLDVGSSLTNSGTISATASADYSDATAVALDIEGAVLGTINNSGNITAEATVGSYDADANAVYLDGGYSDNESGSDTYSYNATASSTSGPLSYTANYAWNSVDAGTWASDDSYVALGSAAALTNSGVISATAVSGYESATASALAMNGAVLGTVANTGTISASATADDYYADAIAVYLDGGWIDSYSGSWNYTDGYTATTVGVITETATNSAWATTYVTNEAYVALGAGAALTNSGTIAASATAGNLATTSGSSASATAVRMYGAVLGAINNSGTISATAVAGYEDAYATGVYLGGGDVDSYSGGSTGTWSESSTAVSQSTSATNWMTDESYVSLGTTGVFANTGSISASAEAGYYSASASALVLDGAMRGTLTNSGSITASAVAGSYYAYAIGVSLDGGDLYTENGTRTNGVNAYTYDYARVSVDGTLTNDGVISADAEVGYSSAYADGVAIYGVIRGNVTNNGEITATATAGYDDAYAGGVYLGAGWVSSGNQDTSEGDYFSLANGGAFTNTGTISAFAEAGDDYASATALYSWGQMAGAINNTGTIRASANVGDYNATAMGLVVSGDLTGTITNSNAIAASADAEGYYADAMALAVWGDVSGTITNTDSLGAYAGARNGGAYAGGLYADHVSGTISNSGTVDVAADGGTGWASATGFDIDGGMSGTGSLTNTGYVGVLAESNDDSVSATGIRVSGAMHDTAMVSNASGALISVLANGTGSESAYGVDLGMLFDNAQFVNAGDISVVSQSNDTSGTNAVVYGVHTDGLYDAAQLVNSGVITVEQSAFGDALVVGLATGSIHNSAGALNSGTINVSAAGQVGQVSATGIAFGSAYAGATMTNSGTITVQTDGSSMFGGLFGDTLAANVQAVGISLDSQMVDSTLANTGTINVTSNAASSSGATTTAFVELFGSAFDFGGDASVYGIKAGLVDGASTISNSGSIVAEATGSDNAAYGIYVRALTNGAMVVNTATIDVDAGAGGNAYGIFVAGGTSGLVSNSGTIGDGVYLRGNVDLTNTGSITNTASFVGGNYTQGVGGSLGFPVQSVTDYGQLAVAGTADFTAGNSVVVLLNPSDDLESGDVLADVVSAGTLTASAFDVSDNVLFWNFTPVIDGNTLDLTANYRGAAGVLANTGYNLSGSLAEVIDGIIDEGADGQYADLAAALNAAPDDAAAAALLAGFLPTLNGDVVDATRVASGGVSNSIDSRIAESRGAASGDALDNGGVWLKTYFGMAEQDKVGNANGYDVDSTGVVIGVDSDVTDAWRVGLAVGLAKADVDAPLAQVDVDSNLFTLYGSYTVNDRTALDLTLGFGSHDYDSVRNAGTFGTASSTFDGDQLSFGANLSRTIKQGDKKVFIPSVSFQYLEVNVGGYSETGAGIMNNTVAAVDETSVSVLAKGTWEWTMANTGVFAAHLGLGFDSTDDAGATVTLAGNGPTYNVKGIDAEEVLLAAGLGYRYVTKKDLEIVVGYDLEAREDFQAGVAAVKFKMPF